MTSYEFQTSDKPLIGKTIGKILDEKARENSLAAAIVSVYQDIDVSYGQLWTDVNVGARAIMALDLKKGDRLAILSTNSYEWVVMQLASAKVGVILVSINPAYRLGELNYALKQSQSQALFLIDKFRSSDYIEMLQNCWPNLPNLREAVLLKDETKTAQKLCYNKRGGKKHTKEWSAFCSMCSDISDDEYNMRQQDLSFDDPINIQYTSGTTGFPKGVVLSHHNLVNNAFFVGEYLKLSPKDRLCIPVPFYHCFGMVLGNLTCITQGSTIVIPSEIFDPRETLQTVQNERCTALHGVPTMFIAELEYSANYDLRTLRTGIMAGSPCPIEIMKRIHDEMNMHQIVIAYGQTETSPVITMTSADDMLDRRVSTVGRPFPFIEIKIIDLETGRIVPRGQIGEICARGYAIMREYWQESDATAKTIDEARWLHTGDLGTMDEEGYIRITGRLKDMVIKGGENIYPKEVEDFLHTHPDVVEAQVVGVPDIVYGEEVAACIKLKPLALTSEEDIRNYCRDRMAHFKIPRYVRFVDDYPMTVTGKIQKFKLRENLIKELHLERAAGVETA